MVSMDDDYLPIIIDVGSGSCKAGFGGHASPTAIIPSVVGREKTNAVGFFLN